MKESPKMSLDQFLSFFPEVDLPATVSDEIKFTFSKRNTPFSLAAVQEYIAPHETQDIDEMTEFIPCFSFKTDADFKAVVYWKGGLLKHEYVLMTLGKNGDFITKKIIAGMRVEGDHIIQSVATIDEDYIIHIIVGSQNSEDESYNPNASQAMNMEILGTGDIVFSLNETPLSE